MTNYNDSLGERLRIIARRVEQLSARTGGGQQEVPKPRHLAVRQTILRTRFPTVESWGDWDAWSDWDKD